MKQYTSTQIRVIGCLIEKSITTPDHYPLTLNALTAACNQKSNREPVMDLSEAQVAETIDSLKETGEVFQQFSKASRVPKYIHRFCNTEFGDLQLTKAQLAILCVLFLRGPQTPGELRTRCQRLFEFENVGEVEQCLADLIAHPMGKLVNQLARAPGKRESRFIHCFCQESSEADEKETQSRESAYDMNQSGPDSLIANESGASLIKRLEQLEKRVNELEELVLSLHDAAENR